MWYDHISKRLDKHSGGSIIEMVFLQEEMLVRCWKIGFTVAIHFVFRQQILLICILSPRNIKCVVCISALTMQFVYRQFPDCHDPTIGL